MHDPGYLPAGSSGLCDAGSLLDMNDDEKQQAPTWRLVRNLSLSGRTIGAPPEKRDSDGKDKDGKADQSLAEQRLILQQAFDGTVPLRYRNFRNIRLINSRLYNVDLTGSDISGMKASGATLQGVRYNSSPDGAGGGCDKATWSSTKQRRMVAIGVDFSGSALSGFDFTDADLIEANFKGAFLDCFSFKGATLQYANFSTKDAILCNAVFDGANLLGVDFTAAHLVSRAGEGEEAKKCSKQGEGSGLPASFQRAKLRLAKLIGAKAAGVDFTDADLRGADLSNADLRGAKFIDADLRFANLEGAKLDGADFTRSKLSFAKMSSTSIVGAVFIGATMSNVALSAAGSTGAAASIEWSHFEGLVDADLDFSQLAKGTGLSIVDAEFALLKPPGQADIDTHAWHLSKWVYPGLQADFSVAKQRVDAFAERCREQLEEFKKEVLKDAMSRGLPGMPTPRERVDVELKPLVCRQTSPRDFAGAVKVWKAVVDAPNTAEKRLAVRRAEALARRFKDVAASDTWTRDGLLRVACRASSGIDIDTLKHALGNVPDERFKCAVLAAAK